MQQPVSVWRSAGAIAGLTAREMLREPVCLMLILSALLAGLMLPMLTAHQMGGQARLAREGALAFHLLFGLLLAAYGAQVTLGRALVSGAASLVVGRALGRIGYLAATALGILGVLLLFSVSAIATATLTGEAAPQDFAYNRLAVGLAVGAPLAALAGAMLGSRLGRRNFVADATLGLAVSLPAAALLATSLSDSGEWIGLAATCPASALAGGLLVTLAFLPAVFMALALATRLATPALIACTLAVLAGGLVVRPVTAVAPPALAALLRAALPDWQIFWSAGELSAGDTLAALPAAATYAVMLALAWGVTGILLFRSKTL
ncbi:MAG: hypothetical protein WCL16_08635 [bacterium]